MTLNIYIYKSKKERKCGHTCLLFLLYFIFILVLFGVLITYLTQINCQIHFIVLHASRKWRWLPPSFHPIDGIFGRVLFFRTIWIANIAYLNEIYYIPECVIFYYLHDQLSKYLFSYQNLILYKYYKTNYEKINKNFFWSLWWAIDILWNYLDSKEWNFKVYREVILISLLSALLLWLKVSVLFRSFTKWSCDNHFMNIFLVGSIKKNVPDKYRIIFNIYKISLL